VTTPLTTAVVNAAKHAPHQSLEAGAAAVEAEPAWTSSAQQRFFDADPSPGYAVHIAAVVDAWHATPGLAGAAVAAALRAAAAAVAEERRENRVSLVWTGPPTDEITLRSTRSVLNTLVQRAAQSLVLVSYASYDVDDLTAALRAAANKGVDVSLILGTKADGDVTFDAAAAFETLRGHAHFYRWPIENRKANFAATARLHAKCAIRDRTEALVTSANLTSAAINDNMELGILIESGPLPARLHRHFGLLVAKKVLLPA
jgi:cardiolipin synthase A/B